MGRAMTGSVVATVSLVCLLAGTMNVAYANVNSGQRSHANSTPVNPTSTKLPEDPNGKFKIGVFWAPPAQYTNATQYDYLKQAGVDLIENTQTDDLNTIAINKKMLSLAAQRGMQVIVADSRMNNILNASDGEIAEIVKTYKGLPGLGGYYVRDEPGTANLQNAARVYKDFLNLDPDKLPLVNLLPNGAKQQWVDDVGAQNLKYLSDDYYPFLVNGTIDPGYFANLEDLRAVGLKNNVNTAQYLQSVGIPGYLARPTANDLRWNVYTDLAYGVKSEWWFTWWTPTHRSQPFTNAIITADGKKTDLFTPVQELDSQMHELGPTLMDLDSLAVYHSGTIPQGTSGIPANFFWKPVNPNDDLLISYMKDRNNGRTYIMVVNKSRSQTENFAFQLDLARHIKNVTEVSKETGKEVHTNYNPKTGIISDTFLPGEGKLYALPPGFAYQTPVMMPAPAPAVGPLTDLALHKTVTVSSSVGAWGWSPANVVDGNTNSTPSSMGWSSNDPTLNEPEWVKIDLGHNYNINLVDLYPRNDTGNVGVGFPKNVIIQVSTDGSNWKTVDQQQISNTPDSVQSFQFPMTDARYIKVTGTDFGKDSFGDYHMQLAEIGVYSRDESRLTVNSEVPKLLVGKSESLKVYGWTPDWKIDNLQDATVTYSSSDNSILSVDKNGVVTGISPGTATVNVVATEHDGTVKTGSIKITVNQLPQEWKVDFYGDARGSVDYNNSSFDIHATGTGIGSQNDNLVYLYKEVNSTNPFSLTARVSSLYQVLNTDGDNGQVGLVFTDGANPGAASNFISLSVNPSGRIILNSRQNGRISEIKGDYTTFPVELKLSRRGNWVIGYYKKGGKWVPFNQTVGQSKQEVAMQKSFTAGISDSSGDKTMFNFASVSDIAFE